MDFIEGAAYVSPSRQELYSSDGDGLYTRATLQGHPIAVRWAGELNA